MVWKFMDGITSEVGFRIEADSAKELLRDVVRAVGEITAKRIRETEKRIVEINISDMNMAIYDLINEIVFLKDTQGLAFRDADVVITGNTARITLIGGLIDEAEPGMDIKSPTMHNMNVRKNGKWVAEVVVDV